MSERAELLRDWLHDVEFEIARREREREAEAGGNPRQQLLTKLQEIGARLRAGPGYQPPTPSQERHRAHVVDMVFRRNGYGRD